MAHARHHLSIAALLSLALGCGLIVNLILKEFSGRLRPRDTVLFGGVVLILPGGLLQADACRTAPLISGEASFRRLAFVSVPYAALLASSLGSPIAVVSILMPTMRVMTGAHYLSDAVLGWLSSLVIFAGVLTAEAFAWNHYRPVGGRNCKRKGGDLVRERSICVWPR